MENGVSKSDDFKLRLLSNSNYQLLVIVLNMFNNKVIQLNWLIVGGHLKSWWSLIAGGKPTFSWSIVGV